MMSHDTVMSLPQTPEQYIMHSGSAELHSSQMLRNLCLVLSRVDVVCFQPEIQALQRGFWISRFGRLFWRGTSVVLLPFI